MNDIRRTILWVIFGFSMVLLWDQWQIHNGHKPTFFPQPAPPAAKPAASASGADAPVPSATASAVPSAGVSAVPSANAPVPPAPGSAAQPARQRIDVNTHVLNLSFDTERGYLAR